MEQRKKALEQARQVIYASNVAIWIAIYDYLWVMLCFFPEFKQQHVMYIFHVYILLTGSVSQWSPEVRDRSQSCFRGGCLMVVAASDMNTWWYLVGCCKPLYKFSNVLVTFWILLPASDFRFRSNGQLTSVHHWRLGLSGVDRQRNLVWSF